jgi:hypothetical protein
MSAYVVATRDLVPVSLFAVGAELLIACGVYALVFVALGISAAQRQLYLSNVVALIRQRVPRRPVSEGA